MRIRYKRDNVERFSNSFNVCGIGEVVTCGEWGGDSAYISDLDVFVNGEWKDMRQAFKDADIVPDNYNRYFGPPENEECRKRGYNP